jgi:hypothetical protein
MEQRRMNWTYLVLVTIMAGALCGVRPAFAQAPAQGPFADVPPHHWAREAVAELASRGLFTGHPDGNYRGAQAMTRYELAVVVQRMLHSLLMKDPAVTNWPIQPIPGSPLTDVPASHWAANAVMSMRQWGLMAGYPDATFAGDQPVTRAEFAVVLQRLRDFLNRLMDRELQSDQVPVPTGPAPARALNSGQPQLVGNCSSSPHLDPGAEPAPSPKQAAGERNTRQRR